MSLEIPENPLTERDLETIDAELKRIAVGLQMCNRAKMAEIDVDEFEQGLKDTERKLQKIKRQFAPNRP